MPKKYRSGFERLGRFYPDTATRYSTAIQAVRENFTGFGVKDGFNPRRPDKLTENQRKQIRRYYNLLSEYTEGGPVYKMTPSELPKAITKGGRKNVEQVMKAAQMPEGRKRAKFIFIKYDGETIPKVKIRDGSPVFVNEKFGYEKEIIELNKTALVIDAAETVMSVAPLVEGAKFFRIVNGRHEFFNAGDLKTLARKVVELQQKYAIGNNSWDKWLHGIAAFYSDTKSIAQIINHDSAAKKKYRDRIMKESAKLRRKRK